MPPSGFSDTAVFGFVHYVKHMYLAVQEAKPEDMSEKEYLTRLHEGMWIGTPYDDGIPGRQFHFEAIRGLALFQKECFGDLAKEIEAGHDKHGRPVTEGQAIQKELDSLEAFLKDFSL